jgi:hypothetical protein
MLEAAGYLYICVNRENTVEKKCDKKLVYRETIEREREGIYM